MWKNMQYAGFGKICDHINSHITGICNWG